MKITSVEKSKRKKDMMLVYVDHEYSFTIPEEDYLILNLYEKKEITQDEIDYIDNVISFKNAKSKAIRYLSLKLRSEKEVKDRLKREGFNSQIIEKTIQELKSLGYINDSLYAKKYIYDRSKLKPKSKKLLRMELISKGINQEIADEMLSDWKVDEYALAEALIRKKFGKYDFSEEKIVKRAYSFLNHRGFSYEISSNAIQKLKSEQKNKRG